MTKISYTYSLANLTPADANPVETNFTRTEQHINQELLERDGSVAMRQQLRLAGDPVAALDAAPKQYVDQVLPVGIILPFGGTGVPAGGKWLACDGSEVQTADWPELYAVIGTSFVTGTPSAGRFNLPNMTGRVPLGATPGTRGGSADAPIVNHTHTIDHGHQASSTGVENVAHVHGDDHQHSGTTAGMDRAATHHHDSHGLEAQQGSSFGSQSLFSQGVGPPDTTWWTGETNTDHLHGVTVNFKSQQGYGANTGGQNVNHVHGTNTPAMTGSSGNPAGGVAATNANLPPYVGVNYVIRAK